MSNLTNPNKIITVGLLNYFESKLLVAFTDVYIGTGANAAAVMVAANHHDRINKGDHVSLTASSNKIWVIIPNTYSPTLTMTGIEVPMVAGSNITEGGVTYKVFSSANTYTGSMSVALY